MAKSYWPLLAAAAVAVSGCYGSFNLTRKLYQWNGGVGGKWVNEGVFLALAILPVYEFATLGDALIANSIEFWTGKNPVTAKNVKSIQVGDEQAVLSYAPESRRLRVDSFEKGRLASTLIFSQGKDGMEARDARGTLIMSARTIDSDKVDVYDATGKLVRTFDPKAD